MKKIYILLLICLVFSVSTLKAQCPITITPSSPSICAGNVTNLTVNGATTYTWSPSTGLAMSTGSIVTANPTTTTVYTVTGTTGTCTSTAVVTIYVNPNPTITINSSSNSICSGSAATLTAMGATTYSWNIGVTSSTCYIQPTSGMTYTVIGSTTAGCVGTQTVNVSVNPNPTITVNSYNAICSGGSDTLIALGANTYTWAPSIGLNASIGQFVFANPSSSTDYTVVGEDANGCIATQTVNVNPNSPPIINITASPSSTICAGGTTTLTASGATSYTWNTGSTLPSIIISPSSTTTFTVSSSITIGCIATQTVQVAVNPLPIITVSVTPVCLGQTLQLSATGGISYSWSHSSEPTFSSNQNPLFRPNATMQMSGNYAVTATDANGCIGSSFVQVVINSLPVITVSSLPNTIICTGSIDTLIAIGASTYTWTPTTYLNPATGDTVYSIPSSSINYTVTGTDANGCIATASTTISAPPSPTVGFVMQKDTVNLGVWYAYPSYSSNVTNATWYWGDGTSSSGLAPAHTYSSSAQYNICVSVFSACGDSAQSCQNDSIYRLTNSNSNNNNMISVTVINNSATGINQVSNSSKQIALYPNPNNGSFTIETNSSTKQTIQIVDINGRIVLTQIISGKTIIDESNLNQGIYNISIIGNETIINKRLIIVK